MIIVHQINNSNIEKIKEANDISFHGVYKSVFENRKILKGKNVVLFIIGNYVGKDNSFDPDRAYDEKFCDWNEIMDIVYLGAKLGWHTWTHPDLTKLSDEEIRKEINPPFPMFLLACPYEKKDNRIIQIAKTMGFQEIV